MDLPFVNPRRQQGIALLVMVIVLILGSTFFLVKQLNSTAQRLQRTAVSTNVLAQAKDALIGYAATNSSRPGALPCPDRYPPGDANEGRGGSNANGLGSCPNASDRIGRLPWKTLGLPDLRDASGERMWYALSGNFLDLPASVVLNSDTPGTLNLNGIPPPSSPYTATSLASSVVGIVFAPGAALSGQNRNPTNSAAVTSVSNYLEGANGDVANDDAFVSALASDTFNDTLLAITHADLFAVVENNVAKKLSYDVKFYLNNYVTQWSAFPFAATFTTPGSVENSYVGIANLSYGLLPITRDPSLLTWANQITLIQTGHVGTGTGTVAVNGACTVTNTASPCITCTSTLSCPVRTTKTGGIAGFNPLFSATVTLQNVGMALVDRDQTNTYSSVAITANNINNTSPVWSSATLRADGSGHADLLFINGKLRATGTTNGNTRNFTLKFTWSGQIAQYLARPAGALPAENTAWFFDNQWYRLIYYAISSGYGPGKGLACVTATCLATVATPVSSDFNKGAVLILAGSAGKKANGYDQTRPSSSLDDYFEGENMTLTPPPSDRVYESRIRSSNFNDKIILLAP